MPVAVMTYAEPGLACRPRRVPRGPAWTPASSGVIVPDLPVDEAGELDRRLLASLGRSPCSSRRPARPDDRLRSIARDLARVRLLRGDLRGDGRAGPAGGDARPSSWAACARSRPPAAGRGGDRRRPRTPPRRARSPTAWWWGARSSVRCSTATRRPPWGSPARSEPRHAGRIAPSRPVRACSRFRTSSGTTGTARVARDLRNVVVTTPTEGEKGGEPPFLTRVRVRPRS